MPTLVENLAFARLEIDSRYRFSLISNLQSTPINKEIEDSVLDAVDEINSEPPETSLTLDSILNGTDTRWRRALFMCAAKNVVATLKADWASNGIDAKINNGEIEIPSRFSDISTLHADLLEEYLVLIEKLLAYLSI